VQAFHVAAFVKHLQGKFSPPTVKQHLAALRMLFDWLVYGCESVKYPVPTARMKIYHEADMRSNLILLGI
jgi:integrase/recombinase XerD